MEGDGFGRLFDENAHLIQASYAIRKAQIASEDT